MTRKMHNINISYVYEINRIHLHLFVIFSFSSYFLSRSWWPCGLRRGSAVACLRGLRVRVTPGTWMSAASVVFCQVKDSAWG
jgi:hypothetical protein